MSTIVNTIEHLDPPIRHAADVVAAGTIVTAFVGMLPAVAAGLGVIWYILQIYSWVEKRWKTKRRLTKKRRSS